MEIFVGVDYVTINAGFISFLFFLSFRSLDEIDDEDDVLLRQ